MSLVAAYLCAIHIFLAAFEYREGPPGLFMPAQPGPVYSRCAAADGRAFHNRTGYSYLDLSTSRPYGLADLYSSRLTAGYAGTACGIEAGWDRFGIEEYRENTFNLAAGIVPMKGLTAAAGVHRYGLEIRMDEFSEEYVLWDYGIALTCEPCRFFSATLCIDNLKAMAGGDRNELVNSQAGGILSVKPVRGMYWSWYCNRNNYGFINSLMLAAHVTEWLSLCGGYTCELSTSWASLTVLLKRSSISYAIRYHPSLGYSHALGLSMTTAAMTFQSMEYHARKYWHKDRGQIERIDINSCTYEELRGIPVISDTVAKRIMQHREFIGPVSRKALFQIGMKDGEIRRLPVYAYGLSDPADRMTWKAAGARNRRLDRLTKRNLFSRLLVHGLTAGQCLRLTQLADRGSPGEIWGYIDSIPGADDGRKKEIKRICSDFVAH